MCVNCLGACVSMRVFVWSFRCVCVCAYVRMCECVSVCGVADSLSPLHPYPQTDILSNQCLNNTLNRVILVM